MMPSWCPNLLLSTCASSLTHLPLSLQPPPQLRKSHPYRRPPKPRNPQPRPLPQPALLPPPQPRSRPRL
ncbi:hypothetical protein DUNSADRAFT_4580 [Dunaliella salina]|uniref:Uncharacterized protein n=1 Tax=Dunaliella salina TaxID=3046 RepID=A0ABQ7FUR8_DUNSA|nr:hypothetical protein DUNSADRAFT_4580 [Dunaliella salina]|eukprot:KAF5826141.1 hypothetical protein DUNSADRAFT_4580 [Dunaliella salina]